MLPSRFLQEIDPVHIENLQYKSYVETEKSGFSIGTLVCHRSFGRGIVKRQYNTSFGTTYDVLFEATGEVRALIAKYAKLEKVIA